MGGKESTAVNEEIQLRHYKINIARATVEKEVPLMVARFTEEEVKYKAWHEEIKGIESDSQFLLLPVAQSYSRAQMCGNHGFVDVSYPRKNLILSTEIERKKNNRKYFEEHDLWFLLYVLAQAQNEMKVKFSSKLGDIRPENVFLSKEGRGSVANFKSWPGCSSSYQIARQSQDFLMAPQDMHNLGMGGLEKKDDFDTQIFPIGLTVLTAATLERYNFLYNYKNSAFDYEQAEEVLAVWRQNTIYSPIFTGFVSAMCALDPKRRVTQRQLHFFITQYEKWIKVHENFIIYKVPATVEQEMELLRMNSVQESEQYDR